MRHTPPNRFSRASRLAIMAAALALFSTTLGWSPAHAIPTGTVTTSMGVVSVGQTFTMSGDECAYAEGLAVVTIGMPTSMGESTVEEYGTATDTSGTWSFDLAISKQLFAGARDVIKSVECYSEVPARFGGGGSNTPTFSYDEAHIPTVDVEGAAKTLTVSPSALSHGEYITVIGTGCSIPGATALLTVNDPGWTEGTLAIEVKPDGRWSRMIEATSAWTGTAGGDEVSFSARCVENASNPTSGDYFTYGDGGTAFVRWVVNVDAPTSAPVGNDVNVNVSIPLSALDTASVAGMEVSTQFLVNDEWVTDQTRSLSAAGTVAIPLSYQKDVAGTYQWRVVTGTGDPATATASRTLTRVLPVPPATIALVSAPDTLIVGQVGTANGQVTGSNIDGLRVALEAYDGDSWVTSAWATAHDDGAISLPIGYNLTVAGAQQHRLRVDAADTEYSETFTVTRLATNPVVTDRVEQALVGEPANVTARVENTGSGAQVSVQFWTGSTWETSRSAITNTAGYVTIPLTYGADRAGDYTYRVAARNAYNVTATTGTYTIRRMSTSPVVSEAPKSAIVGQEATVSADVDNTGDGTPVRVQFMVNGTWSTSQTRTTDADGKVTIPLTYGANKTGTYSYRLAATNAFGTVSTSETQSITRNGTEPLVTYRPWTARVGQSVSASAWVRNTGAGRTVWVEFLVNGRWSKSQARLTNSDQRVTIPLTYGQNTKGTYAWRFSYTNEYGVTSVTPGFKITRT